MLGTMVVTGFMLINKTEMVSALNSNFNGKCHLSKEMENQKGGLEELCVVSDDYLEHITFELRTRGLESASHVSSWREILSRENGSWEVHQARKGLDTEAM